VLYTKHVGGTQFETANLAVSSLAGGAPKIVVRGGDYGRYVPSGHLLYDAEHDG
jgi:serine/threonine-protein kinase